MPLIENLTGKKKKGAGGHMPVKRSLNLANVGEKRISIVTAVLLAILVVVAAGVFSKFAIIDRFMEVAQIRDENSMLSVQIATVNTKIETYVDMAREYAHYTYQDLTADERAWADRSAIMDLIQEKVNPVTPVSAWTVNGNQVMMTITGYSLESVNNMVLRLQEDELVDYCSVATASQTTTASGEIQTEVYVTANIQVFLKSADRRLKTE